MFYVFGLGGPIYRGPLENLGQVPPVKAVLRTRALHATDLLARTDEQIAAAPPAPPPHTWRGTAVSAYAQTQHGEVPARTPLERVSDVMTHQAHTLGPALTVAEAWVRLNEWGVAQAPVVDARGRLVGLLLRADMLSDQLLPAPGGTGIAAWRLAQQPVESVMLTPVPAVAPRTHLRRAARVLLDFGLPGLPVTDEQGVVTGFLSRADILKAVVADPPLDLWS